MAKWNVNNINKLLHAARFAAERHTGHFRKGSRREPYVNHPIEVAQMIAEIGGVDDVDILAAAILHDTVEDVGVTAEEITREFGDAVCAYVLEVTDDKSLPKEERKQKQIEHAPHLSPGAKTIKIADKISNVTDVTEDPAEHWTLQRRQEYILWAEKVVVGLRGVNRPLETKFDDVVLRAKRELSMK